MKITVELNSDEFRQIMRGRMMPKKKVNKKDK